MRLHQIDALRGFALFGILIVNIFVFHAPYPYYGEFYYQFEGIQMTALENMIFFFGGKFMFIYAFLFGYSFWIQYKKHQSKNSFRPYWNRRMILLALFGVLHILLLSFGDILLPYALLGLTLPFFAKKSNSKILFWFFLLYLIPVYEFVLRAFLDFPSVFMQPSIALEEYIAIHQKGNWLELFQLRMKDYFSLANEKVIMYIPKEISLFLIGIIAARSNLAANIDTKKGILFCTLALIVMAAMYFFRPNIIAFFDHENSIFQRILLGLSIQVHEFLHGMCYIVGFFLIWKIKPIQGLLHILSYSGRLSLTNYLMQSLICVVIFSHFGYYGQLTPIQLILTTLVIYLGQLLFSFLWLKKNKYGPMEALWRKYSQR